MSGEFVSVTSAEYHEDMVADQPSLSRTVLWESLDTSPAHARAKHPRLAVGFQKPADESKFDPGTAAHAVLLEGNDSIVTVVDENDWRKDVAKAARAQARAEGKVPLLGKQWETVNAMVDVARSYIEASDLDPPLFAGGKAEQTIVWDDDGVTCRARLDYLHNDFSQIDDYKTTSGSANPERWSSHLFKMGFHVQHAFYTRGLKAVTGVDTEFRWLVQEDFPPYALSVVSLTPHAIAFAQEQVEHGIDVWRDCVTTNRWPSYPSRVCYADVPSWDEHRWQERMALEAA